MPLLDSLRFVSTRFTTHLRYLPSGILLKGGIIVARAAADHQATRPGTATHRGVGDNADLTLRLAVDDNAVANVGSLVAAISVGQHVAGRLRVGERVQLRLVSGHGRSAYIRYGEVRHDALFAGAGLPVGRHACAVVSRELKQAL